jgi:hypothetical protein
MKYLFYFGHPAQYLFMRATIIHLLKNDVNKITILIKTKDVLEEIIKSDGIYYNNILPNQRGKTKLAILLSLIKRLFVILPILLREKPDLLIGGDPSIAILGKILNLKRITVTEDDYNVIKTIANLTYPFTETILCPAVCNVGSYGNKKIGYDGYMKLSYLHPTVFRPRRDVLSKYNISSPFVLIRLAQLTAHHDFGILGISEKVLEKLIRLSEDNGFIVLISSESELLEKYSSYSLKIFPKDLHHFLAQATLFISDSQSMSVEAAMLGTPSIRFSSFAGKISVLEELEYKYNLTYGIDPSKQDLLFSKTSELLGIKELRSVFLERRSKMLNDKINVSAFLTWFLQNYPESKHIMIVNPDYQYKFR